MRRRSGLRAPLRRRFELQAPSTRLTRTRPRPNPSRNLPYLTRRRCGQRRGWVVWSWTAAAPLAGAATTPHRHSGAPRGRQGLQQDVHRAPRPPHHPLPDECNNCSVLHCSILNVVMYRHF